MIWQNAWGWIGLGTLLLPVLIHLLGRGHARVEPFPTLRFLSPSRLLPTRRTRLHDLILLALRAAILTVAVMALAQPFLRSDNRRRPVDRMLARAIVLDTSASMLRTTTSGERAIEAARRDAQRVSTEAQTSTVIETSDPATAIAGGIAWLSRQNGRSELVVLSDFQAGSIDSAGFAAVPAHTGIRLERVAVAPSTSPVETTVSMGRMESVASTTLTADGADVTWSARAPATPAPSIPLLLAGAAERSAAEAAARAARVVGASLLMDTNRVIAIVYPGFEERAALMRRATPLRTPWMADFVVRLVRDALFTATASAAITARETDTTFGVVVARNAARTPLLIAAEDTADGRSRLLLFLKADAGSSTSAALIASVRRGASLAAPATELDPTFVPDNVLTSLQRPPAADAPSRATGDGDVSDGRWFWAFALLLLVAETWLRRTTLQPVVAQDVHDRAA